MYFHHRTAKLVVGQCRPQVYRRERRNRLFSLAYERPSWPTNSIVIVQPLRARTLVHSILTRDSEVGRRRQFETAKERIGVSPTLSL